MLVVRINQLSKKKAPQDTQGTSTANETTWEAGARVHAKRRGTQLSCWPRCGAVHGGLVSLHGVPANLMALMMVIVVYQLKGCPYWSSFYSMVGNDGIYQKNSLSGWSYKWWFLQIVVRLSYYNVGMVEGTTSGRCAAASSARKDRFRQVDGKIYKWLVTMVCSAIWRAGSSR